MKRAFVLGGTGFVGRHIARRLADAGWEVAIGSRGQTAIPTEVANLRHVVVDRSSDESVEAALSTEVDVLVDVIPYEIKDAEQVVRLSDRIGHVIAISTASVYADDEGRTIDEATSEEGFPKMPVPIRETQRRAVPGDATYSTKKVAIENVLLEQDAVRVTVVRPCAVYGPGDTQCREWFFVKRALDQRPFVLLADEGESILHTTSVHNLAEMVRLAAEKRAAGAFNCGDPDPPNVRRIARSITAAMGHEWDEVLLSQEQSKDWKVRNPWGGFHPLLVAMDRARHEVGYEPVVTYDDAIGENVAWILEATAGRDWKTVLPKAGEYLGQKFDYAFEDAFVRTESR